MSSNVPFKIPNPGINQLRAENTTERNAIEPGLRDGYANGTIPCDTNHTAESRADPKYEHWCRPEPTKEFPFKNAEAERYRERQGGLQENTPGLKRAPSGGVIGSQQGVIPPKGSPHFQSTNWGEYNDIDQWNGEQKGTYSGESDEPFDKT